MARLARAEIFDLAEIVAVYLIGKTVRSCYLMGSKSVPTRISITETASLGTTWHRAHAWSSIVRDFGRACMNVAGTAKSVSEAGSRKTHRKFYRARV